MSADALPPYEPLPHDAMTAIHLPGDVVSDTKARQAYARNVEAAAVAYYAEQIKARAPLLRRIEDMQAENDELCAEVARLNERFAGAFNEGREVERRSHTRRDAMAERSAQELGEVVIGEDGFTKGWTVVKWRADLPPIAVGTKLYAAPQAAPASRRLTEAASNVLAERERQINAEGWTPEHDDQHTNYSLCRAGAAYAIAASGCWRGSGIDSMKPPMFWPWAASWWKPSYGRRDLVKAAALMLAEIERLDRLNGLEQP